MLSAAARGANEAQYHTELLKSLETNCVSLRVAAGGATARRVVRGLMAQLRMEPLQSLEAHRAIV